MKAIDFYLRVCMFHQHAKGLILNNKEEHWDLVIEGKTSLLDLKFKDVWRYRDLLLMYVKRDFDNFYRQTILGNF